MRVLNTSTKDEPIDAVKPHPRNPREGDIGAIHQSIEANGFYGSIVAQKSTGFILAGNHRWQAARHAKSTTIPVTWIDVDDDHAVRILLADNRTNDLASYNNNVLSELLAELHSSTGTLAGTGYDGNDLDEILSDLNFEDPTGEKEIHTRTIEAPIYKITGEKPELKQLLDTTKTDKLLEQINKSDEPESVKDFLKQAAYRHTVFNYRNIAEYYAHAPANLQELMENNALVIIDFDKAIENGFVQLTSEIKRQYIEDYEDDA